MYVPSGLEIEGRTHEPYRRFRAGRQAGVPVATLAARYRSYIGTILLRSRPILLGLDSRMSRMSLPLIQCCE